MYWKVYGHHNGNKLCMAFYPVTLRMSLSHGYEIAARTPAITSIFCLKKGRQSAQLTYFGTFWTLRLKSSCLWTSITPETDKSKKKKLPAGPVPPF